MKKKLLYVFIFAIMFFIAPNITKAAELVGTGSCSYTMEKGELIDSQGDTLKVYWTDLYIDNLNVGDKSLLWYGKYQYQHTAPNTGYTTFSTASNPFKSGGSYTYGKTSSSFMYIYETTGKCPEKFIVSASKELVFIPKSEQADWCGSDNSSCFAIGKYLSTSIQKIYTNELKWTNNWYCTDYFDKNYHVIADITLFFNESGQLQYTMSVDKQSSAYKNASETPVTKDVKFETKNLNGLNAIGTMYSVIEGLITTGKVNRYAFIRTDKGHEKYVIGDSGVKKDTCDSSAGDQTTQEYTCTTYNEIKDEIEAEFTKVKNAHNSIDTRLSNEIEKKIPPSSSGATPYYIVKDFSSLNITQVQNYSNAIDNYVSADAYESTVNDFLTYLDGIKEKICPSQAGVLDAYYSSISSYSSMHASALQAAAKAKEKLAERAEELGDAELADQLNEDADTISSNATELKQRITTTLKEKKSQLDGKDLGFAITATEGCGIISSDMKTFLNTILWYIRIAGVVLAIILSMVDYIKAASSFDDKSMSAANKKMLTRVILVAVLFLVPALLEFVLGLLNISTTAGSLACLK